jgi:hypothetical protein
MMAELQNLANDLQGRFEFYFKAKRGDFDDKEPQELNWKQYL